MTIFKITYIRTGSGERKNTDTIDIFAGDERKDGSKVTNIVDAIQYFEEWAEGRCTYENKNAIVNITVKEF